MARYSKILRDQYLRPIEGAYVSVITEDGQPAQIFDDGSLPMPNPFVTNEFGDVTYNASDAVYRMRYHLGGRLLREDDVIVGKPPEFAGPPGGADNTYFSLTTFKASDVSQGTANLAPPADNPGSFLWTPGDFTGQADDVNIIQSDNVPLSEGAWVRQDGASISFRQSGTGSRIRSAEAKLRERMSVQDFGAAGDGVTDDLESFEYAAVGCRIDLLDTAGRAFAGEIRLMAGRYKISDIFDLATLFPAGVTGLTISGAGSGSTEIVFDGPAASFVCRCSRAVTFRDLTFKSSGVDDEQFAFTIDYAPATDAAPLRSWRFERCDFTAFYTCFKVTGPALCSEFYFDKCQFYQCYYLMDNANGQAVNWNFTDCNWENPGLITSKDRTLAAAFNVKAGTSVNWRGGSMVFYGMLVYYNLTSAGVFLNTSHRLTFDGVRIELVDEGSGTKVPIIDRVASGYVSGSNSPNTTLINFSILQRGTVPSTITYANVWTGCSLAMINGECEGGFVTGILEATTPGAPADVIINATSGLSYKENTTNRVFDHDQHNVTVIPKRRTASSVPALNWRAGSLSVGASLQPFRLKYRGPTGAMPQGGTTINLPAFPDHVEFLTLGGRRFAAAGTGLTIELRDQADTTTYGSAAFTTGGQLTATGDINKEMGFQIPSGTPLMLKFTGTPEVVRGFVYVDYQ